MEGRKAVVEDEWFDKGARPALRPIVDWNAFVPRVKVLEQACGHAFSQPVCNEQREIDVAVAQAAIGDCRFVKLVNSEGNQINFDARVICLKKSRLFRERVFKIRIIAKGNAKCDHAASERQPELRQNYAARSSWWRSFRFMRQTQYNPQRQNA